jgi:hypothetical protein
MRLRIGTAAICLASLIASLQANAETISLNCEAHTAGYEQNTNIVTGAMMYVPAHDFVTRLDIDTSDLSVTETYISPEDTADTWSNKPIENGRAFVVITDRYIWFGTDVTETADDGTKTVTTIKSKLDRESGVMTDNVNDRAYRCQKAERQF